MSSESKFSINSKHDASARKTKSSREINPQKSEIKRCVAILSAALMCIQTSYGALEALQSSLNHDDGTTALSLLYVSYMLSSLLLPPLVITRLKCRKTLSLSMFTYTVYIAANFYPKSYTLTPAAVLLGVGSGLMWATCIVYIINMSSAYGKLTNQSPDKYTKLFFSIVYAFSNLGSLIGAIIMSVLIKIFSGKSDADLHEINSVTSSATNFTATTDVYGNETLVVCGLYYDVQHVKEQEETKSQISNTTLYILLGVYVVLSSVAALLCLCLTEIDDDVTNAASECSSEEKLVKEPKKMALNCNRIEVQLHKSKRNSTISQDEICKATIDSRKEESNISLIKSTARFVLTDKSAMLFLAHTAHVGIIKAFSRSTFNAAWVSCWLGIEYVGYVMVLYSSVLTLTSYLSGHFLQFMCHSKIFGLTMITEVATSLILLLWQPSQQDIWVYFLVMSLFAFSYGIVKTQTPSAYSTVFPNKKRESAALQGMMEAVGLSIMFGLSGAVFPLGSLVMFLCFVVIGYILYVFGNRIKSKSYRYCSVATIKTKNSSV